MKKIKLRLFITIFNSKDTDTSKLRLIESFLYLLQIDRMLHRFG